MRQIPRVRCGDQAGAEKLLSKIDTVDYFAKKEEYYDDNETDDERRGRMQFVIASITRMQSDGEYVQWWMRRTATEPLNRLNLDDTKLDEKPAKSGGRHGGNIYIEKCTIYADRGF